MRFPLLGKALALAAVVVVLTLALRAIDGVVDERQERQREAQRNVAASLAGAQTLVGPALQRRCVETWMHWDGEGKDRRRSDEHKEIVQILWPRTLAVRSKATIDPRHRGLFTVNAFLSESTLAAEWSASAPPVAEREHADGSVACEPTTLALGLGDARGVRAAAVTIDGRAGPVLPGSTLAMAPRGLHAVVPADGGAPVRAEIRVTLAGTGSLAWTPVADETTVEVVSDWPHPSFAGEFLPVTRDVSAAGFKAHWQVSALATTAQQALRDGRPACAPGAEAALAAARPPCADTFGVHFIDPVNGYVLSDRAIKYGLLFVVLTFVAVGLVEVMRKLRVHPLQYLLVGCALTVFFLLLVSLSEHAGFDLAYLCASAACTTLLAYYGRHVLHGVRPGLAFGAGIALLYGVLYALLQLEQTALVVGSLLLFAVIAACMIVTRRVDWYALAAHVRAQRPA